MGPYSIRTGILIRGKDTSDLSLAFGVHTHTEERPHDDPR